jgi:hypothetical protein
MGLGVDIATDDYGCGIVARSTLRAITFVCARFASLRLTSIAPTYAAVASVVVVVDTKYQPLET